LNDKKVSLKLFLVDSEGKFVHEHEKSCDTEQEAIDHMNLLEASANHLGIEFGLSQSMNPKLIVTLHF